MTKFLDGTTSFEGERTQGTINIQGNIATITTERKIRRPLKVGVFLTAVAPEDGQRVASLQGWDRVYRKTSTAEVQLRPDVFPIDFLATEVAIVSYTIMGREPVVEDGQRFVDDNLTLPKWQFVGSQAAFREQTRRTGGAASTARGGIQPILLTRRF